MKEELNLPLQYNYTFHEVTNTYSFITKNGIEYKIVFLIDESLDVASEVTIENIYQIIIQKVSDQTAPFDVLVSKTIEIIISLFFENVKNALIYICSEDDDKSKSRFNVFNRWYKKSNLAFIVKVDNIINCNSNGTIYTIYTSLLYHIKNPDIEDALIAYKNIEDYLNEK